LRDFDAEFPEVADIDADDARQGRLVVDDFKRQHLALGIAQCAVAIFPAGLAQQFARLQQVGAQRTGRIGIRRNRR